MNDQNSFFDIPELDPVMWKKIEKLEQPMSLVDIPHILLKNYFHIKSNKTGKLKSRFFILTQKFIFYMKDENSQIIKRSMNLYLLRLKVINNSKMIGNINKNLKCPILFSYSLVFLKFKNHVEIFTNDQKLFKKWKNILIYSLIQFSFHEDFQVIKMIGKGSFAKVYLASKKETNERYAIKAFNKEFLSNNSNKGKDSLINEMFIIRSLNHVRIIKLFEVYESVHSIYFVMELITGGELIQNIMKSAQINIYEIKNIMRNFLEILDYLHKNRIIHRDLKPENILLRKEIDISDLVLADFGLATSLDNPNIIFHHCGTPGYIAPEVLNYSKSTPFYNEKCDIFSAGVIFFILLSKAKPFKGIDMKETIELNKACVINFDIPELSYYSEITIDLLKSMLNPVPNLRISAEECLNHMFFKEEEIPYINDGQEWESFLIEQLEKLNSGDNNTLYYSNHSPLISRLACINGKINTAGSYDMSPSNKMQKSSELNDSIQSKFNETSIMTNQNIKLSPYQIALLNAHYANHEIQNINYNEIQFFSPKKVKISETNFVYPDEEEKKTKFKRKTEKKFTEPKVKESNEEEENDFEKN